MTPLFLQAGEDSPKVILDPQKGIFEISGESRPENASHFYSHVLKWLDQFKTFLYWEKKELNKTREVVFTFKLAYFNSTSAKYLLDILLLLDGLKGEKYPVEVNWHYHQPDEDMKYAGEEFARSLSHLKMEMIEL
ncbi:MAG: DUF1987 domain-containing protein [Bacteroidetes bacterium]|nr:DUF1987 domain-containing protein [Bacteroidota bacterium]